MSPFNRHMNKVIITESDFIFYARCQTLCFHAKQSNLSTYQHSDRQDMTLAFLKHHKISSIITTPHIDSKDAFLSINKKNKYAIVSASFTFATFQFTPDLIVVDGATSIVYSFCPGYSLNSYFIHLLSIWGLGLKSLGISIASFQSVHIKKNITVCHDAFICTDQTKRVLNKQSQLHKHYLELDSLLNNPHHHPPKFTRACLKPKRCDFFDTCWQLPSPSAFDLLQTSYKEKEHFFKHKITHLSQLPPFMPDLSPAQRMQINAESNQTPYCNIMVVKPFLNTLMFPMYCLDIEAVTHTISVYSKNNFFERVPFLFSIHKLNKWHSTPLHNDYFIGHSNKPFRDIATALIQSCKHAGSIIVYDAMLEKQIIKECITHCPDLEHPLREILSKIIDLSLLFKKCHIYFPGMLGRFSLKAIHQAISPHKGHQDLTLQSGADALDHMKHYLKSSPVEQAQLEQDMRNYCKMDTKALLDILLSIKTLVFPQRSLLESLKHRFFSKLSNEYF